MNRFIKKVVVAALIVTTAGVAGASHAQAQSAIRTEGAWPGKPGSKLIFHFHDGHKQLSSKSKGGYQPQAHKKKKHIGVKKHKTKRYSKCHGYVYSKRSNHHKFKKRSGYKNVYIYRSPKHSRIVRKW